LLELHPEGVFLFGVDVELVELRRDLDADKLFPAGGIDADADKLAAVGGPLEFFVDLALDDVFVAAQAVAVFQLLIDAQGGNIAERSGLFPEQGFSGEDGDRNSCDGTDDQTGIETGACAAGHIG